MPPDEAGTATDTATAKAADDAQKSADVLTISNEDFEKILAADMPPVTEKPEKPESSTQTDGDDADKSGGESSDAAARGVADALKTGMADVISAVKAAGGNNQPPAAAAGDALKALEDHVTKQIQQSQGLGEDGARFMTQSVMAGLKPVISAFQAQIKGLTGTIEEMRADGTLSNLDRDISGWLDGHKITDESERQDITDLAKTRAHREKGDGVTAADIKVEVARLANRAVKESVDKDNSDTETVVNRNGSTPPPGGDGLAGQNDLVAKVLNSKDPRDDMGGDRFQRLVEHYLKGGGQA